MNSHKNLIQLTFHYVNGQTESFNLCYPENESATEQELQPEILRLLDKPWWILHLPEQTICVQLANVLKVEVKPSIPEFQGEGVFCDARRVTSLSRTVMR